MYYLPRSFRAGIAIELTSYMHTYIHTSYILFIYLRINIVTSYLLFIYKKKDLLCSSFHQQLMQYYVCIIIYNVVLFFKVSSMLAKSSGS